MELTTVQQIVAAAGVSGIDSLANARTYASTLSFNGTHAVAASTKQDTKKTEGAPFVVDQIIGVAYCSTATPGLKFSPLVAEAGLIVGANVNESTAALTVDIRCNGRPFTFSPVRWPNLVGTVQRPYIPLYPYIITPSSNVITTVVSSLTTSLVEWEIVLFGHYVGS